MKKLNFFVGKLQPITQGHINCINEGEAPCIVYRINSSDANIEKRSRGGIKIKSKSFTNDAIKHVIEYINNPEGDLTEQEKELLKRPFTNELVDEELDLVKASNKNIIDVIFVSNAFEAIARFNKYILDNKDIYEPQYLMCGDDRADTYAKLIDKYDTLPIERGGKEYENVLKGKLEINIGKGRTEGVSGTEVRKAILNKDKSAFSSIMPKGADKMFDKFVKAFDDFKTQLQGYVIEGMTCLKDYLHESLNKSKK